MRDINLTTDHLIFRKSCSPSTVLSVKEYAAHYHLISFGGGMGGARRDLYALRVKSLENNMLNLTLVDDTTITINERFLVYSEPIKIILIELDITEHHYFHSKLPKGKQAKIIEYRYYFLHQNETYEIINDVHPSEKQKKREIHTKKSISGDEDSVKGFFKI